MDNGRREPPLLRVLPLVPPPQAALVRRTTDRHRHRPRLLSRTPCVIGRGLVLGTALFWIALLCRIVGEPPSDHLSEHHRLLLLRKQQQSSHPVAENEVGPAAPPSLPSQQSPANVFYSVARTDRSGSHIADRLLALAYGFQHRRQYAGACYVTKSKGSHRRPERHEALIAVLGLQELLPLACPPAVVGGTHNSTPHYDATWFVPPSELRYRVQELWTPAFVTWIQNHSRVARGQPLFRPLPSSLPSPSLSQTTTKTALVHVRRGDVSPCGLWKSRYWPNAYYHEVIQRYIPPHVPITVYSESLSFEPWDDFLSYQFNVNDDDENRHHNITLQLGTNVTEVWHAILQADYVVLSASSFGYLPALLHPRFMNNTTNTTTTTTKIVYTPFPNMAPQPDWTIVDPDLVLRGQQIVQQLVQHDCANRTRMLEYETQLRTHYWRHQ